MFVCLKNVISNFLALVTCSQCGKSLTKRLNIVAKRFSEKRGKCQMDENSHALSPLMSFTFIFLMRFEPHWQLSYHMLCWQLSAS